MELREVLKYIWCGIKCRFKKRTPRGDAPQPKPPCDDRSERCGAEGGISLTYCLNYDLLTSELRRLNAACG